jgi:hypothetical protein
VGAAVALIVAAGVLALVTKPGDAGIAGQREAGTAPTGSSGRDGATTTPAQGSAPRGSAASAGGTVSGGPALTLGVSGKAVGQTIRAGFLGLSLEFPAVRTYTGADPRQINPVLVQLIRNITPDQRPVLRIGGDSTDLSYVPAPGLAPPPFVDYPLTPSWLATTGALARELDARLILGMNLAANSPALGAAEARAYIRQFGRRAITALEIGNEPNVYSGLTVYRILLGIPLKARPRDYGYPAYRREFEATAAVAPRLTLAGPALAVGPTADRGSWVRTMPNFLAREKRVAIMTVHRYPLRNCYVPPVFKQYPTVSHLLADYSTVRLADSLRRWVRIAHSAHRQLRLDELNSVACRGKPGVSDVFASSLWAVDALFSVARAGVDGVNVHTLPDSAYQLFSFNHSGGRWRGWVRPVYYGLQLFAQAAPPGSRILKLTQPRAATGLRVWGTRAPDQTVRVVLINKNPARGRTVTVHVPPGTAPSATVERLLAPSVNAQTNITLGGRSYGSASSSGRLGALHTQPIAGKRGAFTISVPSGSAALITFGRALTASPQFSTPSRSQQ